jgi:hypothetical protein
MEHKYKAIESVFMAVSSIAAEVVKAPKSNDRFSENNEFTSEK